MLSYADIRDFQAEAASRAAKRKLKPMIMEASDVGNIQSLRRIPNIGNHLPDGWERVDPATLGPNRSQWAAPTLDDVPTYFVDKSGFGGADEPALTIQEFADLLSPGYGYAIVEEGQFQIGIGVFRRAK